VDRRAGADLNGVARSLRWVKGVLMSRPLGLEWKGRRLHVVLVERRHAPPAEAPPSIAEMRADLSARLREDGQGHAVQVMRHLVVVHRELGRKGWPGVAALPAGVLGKALEQAEMLASHGSTSALALVIQRLGLLKVTAEQHEERRSRLLASERDASLEVSEATHEEFEAMERSWFGSLPAPLPADRDELR
jgi:hypothetical protein